LFEVHAFLVLCKEQDIGLAGSFVNLGFTPTKLELSMFFKIYDIIVPSFRGAGDENCYLFDPLTSPKILGYPFEI
jgi:hypothetical protein